MMMMYYLVAVKGEKEDQREPWMMEEWRGVGRGHPGITDYLMKYFVRVLIAWPKPNKENPVKYIHQPTKRQTAGHW